jgi:hypothetical protein
MDVTNGLKDNHDANGGPCVLMFSGGRDSTLAAVRLAKAGFAPTLVTITSNHLQGIESVQRRIDELGPLLAPGTRWLRIAQPQNLRTDTSFYAQTCLPCHHAYVVVAANVARSLGASTLALGYTTYQSDWPEQTPLAVASLTAVLAEQGVQLLLPVRDLTSREQASRELEANGLSSASLEQKCSRQVTNVKLEEAHLQSQVVLWEAAIRRSLQELDRIPTAILGDSVIGRAG